jgi:hypothetical protein
MVSRWYTANFGSDHVLFTDERRARLIEYLKKTYHLTKLPDPQEIDLVK